MRRRRGWDPDEIVFLALLALAFAVAMWVLR